MQILQLTKRHILNSFNNNAYSRGFKYYQQGKVLKFDIYENGKDRWFVRSKVKGSYLYSQRIDLAYANGDFFIEAECDCPVDYNCKHSAAVLFKMMQSKSLEKYTDLPGQWLESFMKIYQTEEYSEKEHIETENEHFMIIRLFREKHNDFDLCKAKMLKNGLVSKGAKVSLENMFYYYQRSYHYSYLTEEDRKLIEKLMHTKVGDYYSFECRFTGEYGAIALKEIVRSGKGYYQDSTIPLTYETSVKKLAFEWKKTGDEYMLVSNLHKYEIPILDTEPPMCIDSRENRLYALETSYDKKGLECMLNAPKMPFETVVKATQKAIGFIKNNDFPIPQDMETEKVVVQPVPSLYLYAGTNGGTYLHMMEMHVFYENYEFNIYPPRHVATIMDEQKVIQIERDEQQESVYRETVEQLGFVYSETKKAYIANPACDLQEHIEIWRLFMEEYVPGLRQEGWQIEIDKSFDYRFEYAENIVIESDKGSEINPWFELSFNVEFGGKSIALLPVVSSLLSQYESVDDLPEKLNLALGEGRFLHIASKDILPILKTVFELFDRQEDDKLIVKPYDAHLIDFDDDDSVVWKGAKELKALSEQLRNFKGIASVSPASSLNATLRDYQQFGLSWLYFLHTFKFGGILADDMGLGKTVQTLALFDLLKSKNLLDGPVLVIMPTSLLGNWKNEIEKFVPNLSYLQLYGIDRADKFKEIQNHDIILTTYQLAQRDQEKYQKETFFYIVLDEAQKIKNPTTKMAIAIKSFTASHRLALSGTPIENHLGELWSIFDFVMPGFLDNLKFFKVLYQNPIEKEYDTTRREMLNRKIKPFILRRTKEEVALELPRKTEIVKKAIFDTNQATLYENIRITMEKKVRDAIKDKGLSRSHITILDALLKLRQVCCHPKLLKLESAKRVTHSAKLELFLELVEELMSENRKVLVFSQFTSMLTILENEIKKKKYSYSKLTGATRKRDEAIEKFTHGKADIFLISLKAGGVGLNLVAADTVIHYDPWWNPAVENQATDRAYRIGQDKPVFVYKLIVENSIEEQILKLQEKKRLLQEGIYKEGSNTKEVLDGEELLSLLKI
ncbi:DEAD/DEAH box helicase [Sulfurovum sp.]|uniref:DEAD/DEAH box helicase n=1 Tax=Sulfurovum sp. TaxID=1969726 RepID=UPI0025F9A722|nr:DEAD/DEAH box helicase [Sulfurovum sp.]